MSRDSSGNHTLPAGNPVVEGTEIDPGWANDTLNDISSSLTDSLSRTGKGFMSVPHLAVNGTLPAPGFAFQNETGTGLARVAAGSMQVVVLGAQVVNYTAGSVEFTAPGGVLSSGNVIVRSTNPAIIAQRSDDAPTKTVQLRAPTGASAILEYGAGYANLLLPGTVQTPNLAVTTSLLVTSFTVSGASFLSSGSSLTVAAGATLALASLPVNPTDAANKQYVDNPRSTALVLPGNAVNPLEAVPLQQLEERHTLTSAQATTTGTSIDFTGIPAWAKRVTLNCAGISTNGSGANMLIRLGSSAGVEAAGYSSTSAYYISPGTGSVSSNTTAFSVPLSGDSITRTGTLVFTKLAPDTWICSGMIGQPSAMTWVAGQVALPGALDRLRIITSNGTDTFDAGSASLLIEG